MIDFSFRKDDQRVRLRLQNVDGLPEGPYVRAFTIDAKAAVLSQNPTANEGAVAQDLPGGHEIEWFAQPIGSFVQRDRIGVTGMVGGNEHALVLGEGISYVVEPANVDLTEFLLTALYGQTQGAPEPEPPGA